MLFSKRRKPGGGRSLAEKIQSPFWPWWACLSYKTSKQTPSWKLTYIFTIAQRKIREVIHLSDKGILFRKWNWGWRVGEAKREESLLHLTVCTLTRLEIVTMNMYYLWNLNKWIQIKTERFSNLSTESFLQTKSYLKCSSRCHHSGLSSNSTSSERPSLTMGPQGAPSILTQVAFSHTLFYWYHLHPKIKLSFISLPVLPTRI